MWCPPADRRAGARRPRPARCPYSPKRVEGVFYELRAEGVLWNSPENLQRSRIWATPRVSPAVTMGAVKRGKDPPGPPGREGAVRCRKRRTRPSLGASTRSLGQGRRGRAGGAAGPELRGPRCAPRSDARPPRAQADTRRVPRRLPRPGRRNRGRRRRGGQGSLAAGRRAVPPGGPDGHRAHGQRGHDRGH